MKQRQYYLDNACAVLIVNMIFFNHQTTFCEYANPVISFIGFILSFYMAWFFFKAGMMFKERPIKTVVRNSAKRLLIPYMFFTFMGLVITACQEFFLEGNNPLTIGFLKDEFWWLINWSTLFPSMACWFLLSLFVVRVVYVSLPRNRLPPPGNNRVGFSFGMACLYNVSEKRVMLSPCCRFPSFPISCSVLFW